MLDSVISDSAHVAVCLLSSSTFVESLRKI